MLDFIYYTKQNETIAIPVSDNIYEKLAKIGLSKVVPYLECKLIIEDEVYEINAAELDEYNRTKFMGLIEKERQIELERLFKQLDDITTIKEVRENFAYIKILTEMYRLFKDENNAYFSYE